MTLLDVNLLVALFDAGHVHHELAHDWFSDQRDEGWATCSATENGLIRILTNKAYTPRPLRPAEIIDHLRTFRESGSHHFWPDAVSLTDSRVFNQSYVRGHRQVADVYLLGLAKSSGGALATFDQSIPLGSVKGATKANLKVITAAP